MRANTVIISFIAEDNFALFIQTYDGCHHRIGRVAGHSRR